MVREQRNELLADHAGRAKNPNFDRHCRRALRDQKKSRRGG
jgi:hypothetical protein